VSYEEKTKTLTYFTMRVKTDPSTLKTNNRVIPLGEGSGERVGVIELGGKRSRPDNGVQSASSKRGEEAQGRPFGIARLERVEMFQRRETRVNHWSAWDPH